MAHGTPHTASDFLHDWRNANIEKRKLKEEIAVLRKKLNEKGIGAVSYYSTPIHKTPFYKLKTKLSITDWASSHVLSLPIHPGVTQKNIEFIAKTMHEIL